MILGTEVVIPLLTAFAISVALSPFVIPFLRRLKIGQTERKEGEGGGLTINLFLVNPFVPM